MLHTYPWKQYEIKIIDVYVRNLIEIMVKSNYWYSLDLTIIAKIRSIVEFDNPGTAEEHLTLVWVLAATIRIKRNKIFCVFVLFVCGFSSHSRIFLSYGEVTIADDGLQILTCAWHSWPLSTEGSLACHTYCDTGYPFIMAISEELWHPHLLLSV